MRKSLLALLLGLLRMLVALSWLRGPMLGRWCRGAAGLAGAPTEARLMALLVGRWRARRLAAHLAAVGAPRRV